MQDALKALIAPQSIVIVGASADLAKLNGRPLHYLLRDGYRGRLYPVNPKYQQIAGLRCWPDLDSLPETPELGVVAVAAEQAAAVVAALGRRGVKTVIVFSSGFGEAGPAGRKLEAELVAAARAHGVRLSGPNNLGLVNAFEQMSLTFSQYAERPPIAGPVAFVSQSGAFGTAVATLARTLGIGLGYFISTGNEADITAVEVLAQVIEDERVRVAVAYLEGMRDGAGLLALADKAQRLGKPLVVTKVGRYAAGQRAAISHTGALAGEDAVFDGIVRQHGIVRAYNEVHALDLAAALSACPVAGAGGIGLITMSGGAGVLMADCAEERGLAVPVLAAETRSRLQAILPAFGANGNPVDVTAQGALDAQIFAPTLELVLADAAVAVCVIWMQHMHPVADRMVELFIETRRRSPKPFIVCWLHAPAAAIEKLRAAEVCVVEGTQRAIDAAAALLEYGEGRRRWAAGRSERASAALRTAAPAGSGTQPVPSIEAMQLLSEHGLQVAPARLAATADEAGHCADALGYPVAVKIESPDLPHKTEAGGVRLGLATREEVVAAAREVMAAARRHAPAARIDGVLVQKMAAPGSAELVLGLRRDPAFGPVVMVGLGGIFVEVLKDVVFAAAPVTEQDAAFMLQRLKARALLDGVRGRPAVDRAALAAAICALSRLALAHPELVELDLNPVFAGPQATMAVDWLMVRSNEP